MSALGRSWGSMKQCDELADQTHNVYLIDESSGDDSAHKYLLYGLSCSGRVQIDPDPESYRPSCISQFPITRDRRQSSPTAPFAHSVHAV